MEEEEEKHLKWMREARERIVSTEMDLRKVLNENERIQKEMDIAQ